MPTYAQTSEYWDHYSPEVSRRIDSVEHGLSGWVVEEGLSGWNLSDRMKHFGVKGLSIAVIKNYKVEWAKGYGMADSADGRIVTPFTLFQAASMSKSIHAVGVMRLVQEGKLNLDADINDYLTSWKFPYDSVSKGKKITLGHLLSHSAGLSVHGFEGYAPGKTLPTIYQILDGKFPANSAAIRSEFEPGTKVQYSGGGTTVSQLIVLDQTKMDYADFMWKKVLQPMGMIHSSYQQPPQSDKPTHATGYREDGKEVEGKYHVYPEQAAAGLWTTPADYALYVIETQLSYAGKSAKVLSQASTKRRLTGYIDSVAALGVFINTKNARKWFAHGGANEGFRSTYTGSLTGGDGVVVMVNSDNGAILSEVVNSVAKVYHWEGFYQPRVKTHFVPDAATMAKYAGRYGVGRDTAKIVVGDGRMFLESSFGRKELHFSSEREFWIYEQEGAEFAFETDTDGKVAGVRINHKDLARKID